MTTSRRRPPADSEREGEYRCECHSLGKEITIPGGKHKLPPLARCRGILTEEAGVFVFAGIFRGRSPPPPPVTVRSSPNFPTDDPAF